MSDSNRLPEVRLETEAETSNPWAMATVVVAICVTLIACCGFLTWGFTEVLRINH